MKAKYCSKCGEELQSKAKFCGHCGEKIPESTTSEEDTVKANKDLEANTVQNGEAKKANLEQNKSFTSKFLRGFWLILSILFLIIALALFADPQGYSGWAFVFLAVAVNPRVKDFLARNLDTGYGFLYNLTLLIVFFLLFAASPLPTPQDVVTDEDLKTFAQEKSNIIQQLENMVQEKKYEEAMKKGAAYAKFNDPDITAFFNRTRETIQSIQDSERREEEIGRAKKHYEDGEFGSSWKLLSKVKDPGPELLELATKARQQHLSQVKKAVQNSLESKNYKEALDAAQEVKEPDEALKALQEKIGKLYTRQEEARLLKLVKAVPAKEYRKNSDLYKQLHKLKPDNKSYKKKYDSYYNKAYKREQRDRALASSKLHLLKWSWSREHSYAIAEGQVKNLSNSRIENLKAVVTFYDKNGGFVTSDDALVEYRPLLPGQTTPFKTYTSWNPAIRKGKIEFMTFRGQKLTTYQE